MIEATYKIILNIPLYNPIIKYVDMVYYSNDKQEYERKMESIQQMARQMLRDEVWRVIWFDCIPKYEFLDIYYFETDGERSEAYVKLVNLISKNSTFQIEETNAVVRNDKVISEAVNSVIEYYEDNHSVSDTPSIERRILTWYDMTDVTDPKLLAAATIYYGEWFTGATLDDMKEAFSRVF